MVANIRISKIYFFAQNWGKVDNKGMAFIRKFKTASGATGVQVCWKQNGEVVRTEHIGSANSEHGLEKLLKKAQKVMDAGKRPLFDLDEFDRKPKN